MAMPSNANDCSKVERRNRRRLAKAPAGILRDSRLIFAT
jgi:hypothetical protein